jgi:PAS domain S-box-containing protein
MSSQKLSVATLVIIALVTATTLLLGAFGISYYAYDRNRQFKFLQDELDISADQIATGLASPVWDYDDVQIDRIIESVFANKNIYGVVVDADGKIRLRLRDAKWQIASGDKEFPAAGLLVEERVITLAEKSIGAVKVFSSPKFVKEGLRKTLLLIISIILVVDLTLILSLYLFIWYIVIKPLKIIEQYAVTFKAGGGGGAMIAGAGFPGELNSLRASIEKMVSLLDARYAALQKEAERYIESEERFRTLVEQAGDAMLLIDKRGRFIDCNKRACESLGYSREELIRMSLPEIDSLFPQERYDKLFSELQIDEVTTVEGIEHRKDKTSFPVEVRVGRIMLRGEAHLLALIRDVTERLRVEEEREKLREKLLQAQKMEAVGRLAGGVAHDFNNMLSIIIGRAELALMKLKPTDLLYKHLSEIAVVGKRSADLTRQLLGFARKQTIAPRVLNLNDTIESLLKMLRRLIGEDIDLLWKPAPGLWPVKMDPVQIDQVLANLVINARDAITDVGKVTIETGNVVFDDAYCATHAGFIADEFTMFAVSDNGCGIEKETLPNIFEPFFTTKELGKGTGLGLATVYGIARQNHGFINAYSELGKGSTFKIYLPRYAGNTARVTSEASVEAARGGTETVLVVEDEPEILEVVNTMLTELGYVVLSVGTPGEAIRLTQEHAEEIHLLMTDVVMPEMNGRDLADRLLSLYPNLKCLFMSGYTANVIAHHGVLDEGVHFIQKPFAMKDLAAKIRAVLDQEQFKSSL